MAKFFASECAVSPMSLRLVGSASILALACAAMPAMAQDNDDDDQADNTPSNTIVVSGFRQSLQDALDAKRNSGNVVDGINAEDIGKSADQNIADALQRVTGISIERSEGEGSTVTVRGIDANLNNVTLNGVTLTNAAGADSLAGGGDAGQAVDFSAFSSDLLQRIEVAKTASADQNEGSLGGAIRLTTFQPLGVRRDRRVFAIQARYSEFADEEFRIGDDIFGGDYRVNIALSEKLFGNTLGLSLIATSEKSSGRFDEVGVQRYEAFNLVGDPFSDPLNSRDLPGGVLNSATGEVIFDGDIDADGDGVGDRIRFFQPREIQYRQRFFETTRNNVTGTIQWRPTPTTDIKVDLTYSRTDRDRNNTDFRLRPFDRRPLLNGAPGENAVSEDGGGNVYDPNLQTLTNYRLTTFPRPRGGTGADNIGFARSARVIDENHETTFAIGFDIEQELGDFTVNLSGGRSDSKFTPERYASSSAQLLNGGIPGNILAPTFLASFQGGNGPRTRDGLTKGFDCTSQICQLYLSDTVDNRAGENGELLGIVNPELAIVDDPGEFIFGAIAGRDVGIDDVNDTLFLDVDWDAGWGPIAAIQVGAKYERRHRVQNGESSSISRFIRDPNSTATSGRGRFIEEFLEFSITPVAEAGVALRDGFGDRIGLARDSITDGIITYDPFALREIIQAQVPDAGTTRPALQNFRDLELTIWGGYAMLDFDMLDGRLFGDVGLRYARTDVDVAGGAVIDPSDSQFTIFNTNTPFFGFAQECVGAEEPFEEPCPNTATFEEAQARLEALFGPDLIPEGAAGFVPISGTLVTDTNTYDNWLPSLNVNFLAMEDLLIRFAASKTMARPNIDRLRPNGIIREATFGDSFGNAGNPQLLPFTSKNLDLSVEWYFDDNSLFSVALFNKDLKDAERVVSQALFIRDPRGITFDENGAFNPDAVVNFSDFLLPFTPDNQPTDICLPQRVLSLVTQATAGPDEIQRECEIINFRRPINTGSGYVRGVEVALQHSFTYLPGILGGFGFTANYTYADSQIDEQIIDDGFGGEQIFREAPLPNTSNHTVNATVFYERNGLQLRAAYNWRSDYLSSSAAGESGTRTYVEANDRLDLSGGYDLTNNISLNFQVVNVLDSVRREYAVIEADTGQAGPGFALIPEPLTLGNQPTDRFELIRNSGRIFRFGARFNF